MDNKIIIAGHTDASRYRDQGVVQQLESVG